MTKAFHRERLTDPSGCFLLCAIVSQSPLSRLNVLKAPLPTPDWLLSTRIQVASCSKGAYGATVLMGLFRTLKSHCSITLADFCEHTSLHGWRYIFAGNSPWRHIWVMIVCASIMIASFFIFTAASDFNRSTVVTTIHSTTESLDQVYFPAVTICNINQVNEGVLKSIFIKCSRKLWEHFVRYCKYCLYSRRVDTCNFFCFLEIMNFLETSLSWAGPSSA